MTESKPPQSPTPPERSEAETHKTSGRISFDKRGNPVWEWAIKTGIFGRDIDTQRLRALEAKDLKIVEDSKKEKSAANTARRPAQSAPVVKPLKDAGGGMNPYDNTSAQPKIIDPMARQSKSAPTIQPRQSWWESLRRRFSREKDD